MPRCGAQASGGGPWCTTGRHDDAHVCRCCGGSSALLAPWGSGIGTAAQVLAKKMIAIMELSQQQLSKQDHYDYGLR